jgi:hypothetical protein
LGSTIFRHRAPFPDAKRLPDQTGLSGRRQPIKVQAALLVSVL